MKFLLALKDFLYDIKEFLIPIITIILTFITPIKGMLITTTLFVAIDTLFGIYASIKLGGIKSYKSSKLFNLVPKTFFYLSTIILAYLVNQFLIITPVWGIENLITKAVCAFWIYIEIKSLDETSMKLGNKSFWVLLKEAIRKLYSIKKDLSELIEPKNDDKKDEEEL
ncbi:phage holin family protein [Flavobacterium enshiense]|uniref:phage holin family protein n=1 Tax=Flavobacterium enshiense TaxID=1341165 RepID=UPI00345D2A78